MAGVLDEVASQRYQWPRQTGRRRVARAVGLAIGGLTLLAMLAAGYGWWYRGGTLLRASGGGYGKTGIVDQQFSFGIDLNTASGPSVVLEGVDAAHSSDLQVSWSVYRNGPDEMGFGMWDGALQPRWPTAAINGYRVTQPDGHPERGGTWLVGTVRATAPGVYHLSDIRIRYRSGPRTRHISGDTDMCLLAVPGAALRRISAQVDAFEPGVTDPDSVDPLVRDYEQCADPNSR